MATSAHGICYQGYAGPSDSLGSLPKPLFVASIAICRSRLEASQAGRRRFEPGRPLFNCNNVYDAVGIADSGGVVVRAHAVWLHGASVMP